MARTRVKVCCISSVAEAQAAIAAGVDALGLVGPMPSGPGTIGYDAISEISNHTPPGIARFLLSASADADAVVTQVLATGVDTVQLVREVPSSVYYALRRETPARIVQVIHVLDDSALAEAKRVERHVDALLLDSGRPSDDEFGGTGRVHDWSISARIVEAVDRPVFLAGGLTADSVAEAVRTVRPFGVDVCSGVRTDERLDVAKLSRFSETLMAPAA